MEMVKDENGPWRLICTECGNDGHVSEAWVEHRRVESVIEYEKVAMIYPDLDDSEPMTSDPKADAKSLFGEEAA